MTNLFKKAAVFTDLHWGLKSNSIIHNRDCEAFIDWFIATAKEQGCETGMFLGDWHNHRASINLQTLQFSLQALEKLSAAFDQFYFIPGNHDLYYRDKRDIHGAEWAKHLPNIVIVNDWFQKDDVIIAPWLVGDDHKRCGVAHRRGLMRGAVEGIRQRWLHDCFLERVHVMHRRGRAESS
jgi:DNA repair exonuclease SbcCD nuclease subunit